MGCAFAIILALIFLSPVIIYRQSSIASRAIVKAEIPLNCNKKGASHYELSFMSFFYCALQVGSKQKVRLSLRGFSLIEVMIVLLLIGIILVKGIPFTSDWVNGAKVTDAESALIEAVGLAKAKALRNGPGIINGGAVAAVCMGSSIVKVVEAANDSTPAACSNSSPVVWQSKMPMVVTVGVAGAAFACLCVDAKAQYIAVGTCAACSTQATFTLVAGGVNETIDIF